MLRDANWKKNYKIKFFSFLNEYANHLKNEHGRWIGEDLNMMEVKKRVMKNSIFYMDEETMPLPNHIIQHCLDHRYLLIYHDKNGQSFLRGINKIIKRIFIDYHFTPSLIEEFYMQILVYFIEVDMGSCLRNILKKSFQKSEQKK